MCRQSDAIAERLAAAVKLGETCMSMIRPGLAVTLVTTFKVEAEIPPDEQELLRKLDEAPRS